MRVSHKFKNLTTSVWNVGGLTEEKINDQKFIKNFRYHIICLAETHTIVYSLRFDSIEIYLWFTCHAFSLQHSACVTLCSKLV